MTMREASDLFKKLLNMSGEYIYVDQKHYFYDKFLRQSVIFLFDIFNQEKVNSKVSAKCFTIFS